MLWGPFARMLKRLNPNILFYEGPENNFRSLGVYLNEDDVTGRRARFLFGVNRDWVPTHNEVDSRSGKIIRKGWREAVVQLYEAGAVANREYYREITRGWRPHALL